MSTKHPKPTTPKKTATAARVTEPAAAVPASSAAGLLPEVRELILTTRQTVARGVNAALTLLYWQIGDRIRRNILRETRAGYGDEIVSTLSRQLTPEFGRGFSEKALRHMVQFAEVFPDEQIVVSLIRELSWLDRHERQPGEEPPIGLILCAGKSAERIELLELEKSSIRVAEYLTELPPKEVLQLRLHEAVAQARARLEQREDGRTEEAER
jgi:DUF1016 N-terminal domain